MKSYICFVLTLILILRVSTSASVTPLVPEKVLPPQVRSDPRRLKPGEPIESRLEGGQNHSYDIQLDAGMFLHLVVEQRGIDVVVELFGLDGAKLAEVDSPNGAQGPEPLLYISRSSGNYRIDVHSLEKEAAAGRYDIRIEELRNASSNDYVRVAASDAVAEAGRLYAGGTSASLNRAIEKLQSALPLWKSLNAAEQEGETLSKIGLACSALGEMRKALDYFNRALPVWKMLGDRRQEAVTLNNVAASYESLSETQAALDHYTRAIEVIRSLGDRFREAIALNNLGLLYFNLGRVEDALDHFNRARALHRELGNREQEAVVVDNLAGVYDTLGEKERSLDYYDQALKVFTSSGDHAREAVVLNGIAKVHAETGEEKKALEYFLRALSLQRTAGNRSMEAVTLNNIAGVHRRLRENKEALDYLNQSLALRRAVGDKSGEAYTLNNIGVVLESAGDKQTGREYLLQALMIRRAIKDSNGQAATLYNMAHLERGRGNLSEALTHIRSALEIVESMRAGFSGRDVRTSYFSTVRGYYDLQIDLLMRLHRSSPSQGYDALAMQASEKARARSLLEILIEAGVGSRQGIDPALLQRESGLQQQLNAHANAQMRLLSGAHNNDLEQEIARQIDSVATELQSVRDEMRAKSPRYAALVEPPTLGLSEIQQHVLDSDTLLLEYALGAEGGYVWAVTNTSINGYQLPPRDQIEDAARLLYRLLSARNEHTQFETARQRQARMVLTEKEYRDAASKLSDMLLGPVAAHLNKKRLLIVAEGAMQFVPFGALNAPAPEEPSTRNHPASREPGASRAVWNPSGPIERLPLIVDHEIVNIPSASVAAVLRRELAGRKPAGKTLAVLADPVFAPDDPRVNHKASTRPDMKLPRDLERSARESGTSETALHIPRLPLSRLEAEIILGMVPESDRMGALDFQASRTTAISGDLSHYRYVHFASHGLLNASHPELSGIVLSLVDEQGRAQEGFLRLHEVYSLKLPAELVVLSACQTALGKEVKGEGLIGLTRGFMYAGAARVVASLWKIDDRATAELMKRFYSGMLGPKQLTPAAALRAAQIEMSRTDRWSSPYYWAGFVLQGEWR